MPRGYGKKHRDDGFYSTITHTTSTRASTRIASLAIRCMRTRSQARNQNRRQQQITTVIVEEPEFPMADNRTMAQMLQAPIEGYEDAISKTNVRYSRSHAIEQRASTNAPLSTSTPSNSFEFQQLPASLEDKMDIRMSRLEKMISEKNVTTPATGKAVEEVCVNSFSPVSMYRG
ncbi:hypothetical protein Tco_1045878 [Tanacetum coccineum]